MRTRRFALVALLATLSPLAVVATATPAAAAPVGDVTTSGWTWEVLTGENQLFGEVTPPPVSSVGGLDVASTAPTLRAPSIPMLSTFIQFQRWTFDSVVIDQPIANGPATITADLSGPGGTVDVTAVVSGGTVEVTLVAVNDLAALVAVEFDPGSGAYAAGELDAEVQGSGTSLRDLRGWYSRSSTHHSAAWSLTQLESDPNDTWVIFIFQASAPARFSDAVTSASLLERPSLLYVIADGPVGVSTPADTWIVRVSLDAGVGCASDPVSLTDRATALVDAVAPGDLASGVGCLETEPVAGSAGVPLDTTVPLSLNGALSSTSWWADRDELELVVGELPEGITVALEFAGSEPQLRVFGTPAAAGSFTVPFAIGGASTDPAIDLVDAVAGELTITIAPALAATGTTVDSGALAGLALALFVLGGIAIVRTVRRRA